ncbi:MAG: hypothetical protein A2X67_12860 [Ignavibacteria bacterium GWA2_55_11]|nr:MAG: hypothetical protein A2X67_12860 [Ignavibacteria bacterium GWA2_55_11]OGU71257.1 MAG: hypothetical protein A3H45_00920 [Ignavibacteria bacterium RIFCSPLOWO2_02_FULL_55_14]
MKVVAGRVSEQTERKIFRAMSKMRNDVPQPIAGGSFGAEGGIVIYGKKDALPATFAWPTEAAGAIPVMKTLWIAKGAFCEGK